MQGKIMKGVGGFYYIHPHNTVNTIYECKAKGAFRNQKIKPAVGDKSRSRLSVNRIRPETSWKSYRGRIC